MPYIMRKTGDKWCVFKKKADGSAGANRGCSETREMAVEHMRALYANEKKELGDADLDTLVAESIIEDDPDTKEQKMYDSPMTHYVPSNVTSFAAYEEAMLQQEKNYQIVTDVAILKELALNIAYSDEVTDKEAAMLALASEFAERVKSHDMEMEDEEKEVGESDDKAVLSGSSRNDLPDSAFMYIEPGGKKDESGRTVPRSLRHLPIKNASGEYDIAHVRNAIARIPQMKGISSDKKKALQARARSILAKLNKGKEIGFADELIMGVSSFIKSKFESDEEISETSSNFFIWKEGARDRFLVRYSNNFRDDDNPPEIISEASHQHFVRAVENKEAAMPELWLWHRPEWRLGDCDMVAYDESGFAIASGLIDVGKEKAAEQAAELNFICSHGMPKSSLERDPVDPTVITKHITTEISLLPEYAAANKLTGYILLGSDNKEEEPMAIPAEKRAALEEQGFDPALLDKLEAMNKEDAAKALEEGREYKEKDAETADTLDESAVSEQVAEETPAQDAAQEASEEVPAPVYPTVQEVASAFETVMTPILERIDTLEAQLGEVSKQLKETVREEDEKVEERIKSIPPASLAALLAQQFSAVGSKEAKIDGRESLAKSGPQEAPAEAEDRPHIGIPFIDKMLTPVSEDN